MVSWYQNLSLHIDPIAFTVGSFSVRWYAISYLVAFLTVYCLLKWRVKHDSQIIAQISNFQFPISKQFSNIKSQILNEIQDTKYYIQNTILDFLLVAFFLALIGGRIGYVLLYNFTYFINNPISIIWPFENGNFVGLYGMSYHGGLVGVLIGSWIFLRVKKINPAPSRSCDLSSQQTKNLSGRCGINFLAWADFVVPAVPLGYFFGRIGNFLNGELYGRITNSSLGMCFANNQTILRHPSQIYEAVLEGLLLFAILWKLRNKKLPKGWLLAIYLIGYGILRIIGEQFREPDPQIGLLLNFFTLGQLLSVGMIFLGAGILVLKNSKR
ncbi:MAG TPA: prolipoprotein diacylglyceryl transferase [Candidatus Moranbacteria bacterium]|nr:prolipoprotein diacylglyceryl transferase [Candidatus Moranbacteria bacterium]HRY28194.1 prolipoprotein diacylglyceryl transferase [Candidatus Moranbacteria bacterium]